MFLRREKLAVHKKLSRLIEPNIQPCFLCLILFALAAVPIQPWLAAVEAVITIALFIAYRQLRSRRRQSALQYIETIAGGVNALGKNSLLNTPLPVVVFRADAGEIIWANDGFIDLSEAQENIFEMRMSDVAPGFSWQWITDGGQPEDTTQIDGCICRVYGAASRLADGSQIVTAYFVDVTGSQKLQRLRQGFRRYAPQV